ncbi:hypothetical protein B0H21DRAFT_893702 [Amylocystis lapponica]|nr:hypothetical protein B0H21DRAFT_893702 [Amylocystis lapponica]
MSTLILPYFEEIAVFFESPTSTLVCTSTTNNTNALTLRDLAWCHRGKTFYVLRGTIGATNNRTEEKVVVKVIVPLDGRKDKAVRRLYDEYDVYQALAELQGDCIPRCYGLYEGIAGGEFVSCLLLQDCGRKISELNVDAPGLWMTRWVFRERVMRSLERIHHYKVDYGFFHGDFDTDAVVVDETGRPFIVDFDEASEHDGCDEKSIAFHTMPLPTEDIECQELYDAAVLMQAWRTPIFIFYDEFVTVEDAKDIGKLVRIFSQHHTGEEALRIAHEIQETIQLDNEERMANGYRESKV